MAAAAAGRPVLLALVAVRPEPRRDPELAAQAQQAKQAMSAGNFELAAKIYADLVKAVPNNPGLLLNLGMARTHGGA